MLAPYLHPTSREQGCLPLLRSRSLTRRTSLKYRTQTRTSHQRRRMHLRLRDVTTTKSSRYRILIPRSPQPTRKHELQTMQRLQTGLPLPSRPPEMKRILLLCPRRVGTRAQRQRRSLSPKLQPTRQRETDIPPDNLNHPPTTPPSSVPREVPLLSPAAWPPSNCTSHLWSADRSKRTSTARSGISSSMGG